MKNGYIPKNYRITYTIGRDSMVRSFTQFADCAEGLIRFLTNRNTNVNVIACVPFEESPWR